MQADIVIMCVMGEDVIFRHSVFTDFHDLQLQSVQDEALVPVFSEYHLLAVFQDYRPVGTGGPVGNECMGSVVENDAVHEHFHHRCSLVHGGGKHDFFVEFQLGIKTSRKECPLGAEYKAAGIERMLYSPVRGSLRDRTEFRGRGILPLGQAVNPVVEQYYIDVNVSSDGMDEMISSDSEGIPVTACLPYGQFRIRHLDAGRHCGGTAVDTVESVRIHIIRKSRRTADTGNHHQILFRTACLFTNFRQSPLKGGKNGMVTAAGTPSYFLIAFEILECISVHNLPSELL